MAVPQTRPANMQVAPVSGADKGIQRAQIKQGIREIVACKDAEGKIGLRIRHVNNVSWLISYRKHFSEFWRHTFAVCFFFDNFWVIYLVLSRSG